MVNVNFENVRCVDGLLAWPSLADNSGSLLVVDLAVLLLGSLVVRLPIDQFGSWSMGLVFFFNSVVNFVVDLDII